MSRARRIALNSIWLLISQILPFAASIFVIGYVARGLGDAGFGLLEASLAMATMASPIIFAGIQIILIREIVRDPERGPVAVGDALVVRLLLLPLYAGVVYLATPAIIPREMVLLAVATLFFVMYLQSLTLAFEAAERMHHIAISTIVLSIVGMTLSVLAVAYDYGPTGVLGARLLGQVAAFLYLLVAVPSVLYWPKIKVDFRRWARIVKMGVPLAVPYLLGLVLLEVDKYMLISMLGPEAGPSAAGQYSAVTVLAYKFDMVIIALATAVTPALVATWSEGRGNYQRLLGGALRVALLLGLPVAIGTDFISRDIIDLIFGEAYVGSAFTLAVITYFVPLQFVNRVMAASLGATDRERWVLISVTIAVVANVAMNAVLIPRWSYEGAAVATVASELLLVALNVAVQRKDILGILRHLKVVRVLISAGVFYGALYLVKDLGGLAIFVIAILIYPVLLVVTRSVSRAELDQLRGRA